MIKQFTELQLFSIVDGRLATDISDVYDILNHVCDQSLMTHHLPVAFDYVKSKNPKWLQDQKDLLLAQGISKDMEFTKAINIAKANEELFDIPQLKDEFDTSDFEDYMIEHSLLKGKEVIVV